jgi:uncharacterized RDD family membrane protein YckC
MSMDPQVGMAPVPADERASGEYGHASGPRAGFWRRFAGAFIDWLILVVVEIVLVIALKGAGRALSLLVAGVYFTMFVGGARGQTPGMSAMGIRVISFDGSGSIGYGRGFIRWIGSYLSALVFLIGYLWMLWDKEKQCWHDKFASDVVVPVSAYPVRS